MAGKKKRECDVHTVPHELLKAFAEHCNRCEAGCPMGCEHRKQVGMAKIGATTPLELMLDYRCGSIMMCFSEFALSKAVVKKDGGKKDGGGR